MLTGVGGGGGRHVAYLRMKKLYALVVREPGGEVWVGANVAGSCSDVAVSTNRGLLLGLRSATAAAASEPNPRSMRLRGRWFIPDDDEHFE